MDLVTPSFGLIFWHSLIFLMLLFFLSKFAWKPIINFIDQREKEIQTSIEKSDQLIKEFQKIENKKKIILKEAFEKRDIILKEAVKIKDQIKVKAKKEGLLEREKMLKETEKIIHMKKKDAFKKLKSQIGGISIKIAEKILTEKLNNKQNKQEELIKKLVEKLC
ncbi:F0F1 ATP synthase subunit B [Blattabacterium cuenoti]|uniref:F0F1 ATP synthase subunit B n=1 Tax=Blattabacterium cuenoti TaxID=1653831 RepID=UPI00163C2B1C|nr:F0F1 ATP synthase subunit B [Blattabacterium cuenoti]